MNEYRPFATFGAQYFFTVRMQDHASDLLVREIRLLRLSVQLARQSQPFVIDAAVVLPNRLHMIWTMPPGDDDYGTRLQAIKTTFARHVPRKDQIHTFPGIWQRRYWEQRIASAEDYREYADLIATAPVEEGLVKSQHTWPYSSFWPGRPKRIKPVVSQTA